MVNIDTLIAYESGELSEEQEIAFIQSGIDEGWIWNLQGHYGRTANRFILAGACHPKGEVAHA